jgi:signal recognition particle receptor subunit beta
LAVLDQEDSAVVLGVVYDGPPEAGKTTSVRALARSFGSKVFTPQEQDGRTVFFDWLEHTGGRFDGAPIRCQIISVPGQECWSQRRTHLLERADVVVFVGDTSRSRWALTLARLRELCSWLEARPGAPVGVVFQANRRDAPDAVGLEEIRQEVRSARVALVESVAVDGNGVREAFVFAVRLALDRVREEQNLGNLPRSSERLQGPELLAQLLSLEPRTSNVPKRAEEGFALGTAEEYASSPSRLPNHEVASGLVWPPVEGRILLREAVAGAIQGQQTETGDYLATLPSGFRAASPATAAFSDLDDGRRSLVAWARLHAGAQGLLSKGRCIVLSGSVDGGFRLWQIVRQEPSLRELFVEGCDAMLPRHAARQLATASRLLTEAQARGGPFTCTLDTIGASDFGEPMYVADMPLVAPKASELSPEAVARELSAVFSHRSADDRLELCRALDAFQRREPRFAPSSRVGALLSDLLSP